MVTHQQIADSIGISRATLRKRLRDMPLEVAIKKPNRVKGPKSERVSVNYKCPKCSILHTKVLNYPYTGRLPAAFFCTICRAESDNIYFNY